jgi:hypothetical protein
MIIADRCTSFIGLIIFGLTVVGDVVGVVVLGVEVGIWDWRWCSKQEKEKRKKEGATRCIYRHIGTNSGWQFTNK